MTMSRLRIIVKGVVQGVGFRLYAKQEAARLGLAGYVCNRSDGGVECCIEGDDVAVQGFLRWAYQGPDLAHVDSVDVQNERYMQEFQRFEVR